MHNNKRGFNTSLKLPQNKLYKMPLTPNERCTAEFSKN